LSRLAPIIRVLARHGFGTLAYRLSLGQFVPARFRGKQSPEGLSAPKRLRLALEELGPTFVKLGQVLSTRPDLLPEPYIEELRQLTEHVPPFETAIARRIVETELKHPIPELFLEFGEEPIASGSIGQVYNATLLSGRQVVVKVKRPQIEKVILADLDLFEVAVPLLDRIEELKPLRLPVILDEFRRSLLREMDFVSEGSFTTKIREDLADNPNVRVPEVIWDMTTPDVLVMERLAGISLSRQKELAELGIDRAAVARALAECFLHQFFRTGLFHADPHPGNILITSDGRIGLVDFGMAGRLSTELRSYLATSFIALTRRDLDIITDIYLEIGALSDETDVPRLKTDLQEALDKYYGIPLRCLDMQKAFGEAMRVARVHHVLLPRDFVLLGKSFVTMISMARELDPSFDLAAVAKPYALIILKDKLSPSTIGHDALSQLWNVGHSLRKLPRDLRSVMRRLLGGSLQFTLRWNQFDRFVTELDKATNRLAFSIIVSAIVLASSILLHAKIPPHMESVLPGRLGRLFAETMPDISVLGLAGFLVAGIFGLLLAVAIWRSGRL